MYPNVFGPNKIMSCLCGQLVDYALCEISTEFTCKSTSTCVPLFSRCDGWEDCPDGSDELPTSCPPKQESSCADGRWMCGNGVCIDEQKLCDGVSDCDESEDEISCSEYIIT